MFNMSRKHYLWCIVFIGLVAFFKIGFAETTPVEDMRSQEIQQKEELLRDKVEQPKKASVLPEPTPLSKTAIQSQEKVFIKEIKVTESTLIPKKEIRDIVLHFENKELTLKEIQEIADRITDAYRQKGFITSRAYLPPQNLKEGVLTLKVIEGQMGEIEIKGNRFFKEALLRKKIRLNRGAPFNYNTLRRGLTKINEQPDRSAHTVIMPGKEPKATDVVLEIKDRLPVHMRFNWDNYGSRYIGKDRYSAKFMHNNLLGFDDKLAFQYELGQEGRYFLKNISYLFPYKDMELGFYLSFSRVKLGEEYQDLDARGKSKSYGLFANHQVIDTDTFDLKLNFGFDYKDITSYQSQVVSSTDRLRVAKTGLDMDMSDKFGRSIFTYELDFGIPEVMGGLNRQDSKASRSGSGGKFLKNTLNFFRLQKLPFSSLLLWKNQLQLSPYILPSAEQFQIGGIANVRGYPSAEASGDRGYTTTFELSLPFYLIPKDTKMPFSKAKLYDAFRVAFFYDWANTQLRRPSATEEKNKTLSAAGWGFRMTLPEDFSLRVDFGWPLDNTPTDGDHMHTWAQVSKNF